MRGLTPPGCTPTGDKAVSALFIALAGHANVGKTSLVSVLTRDATLAVEEEAGTTRSHYLKTYEMAGEEVLAFVDTLGSSPRRASTGGWTLTGGRPPGRPVFSAGVHRGRGDDRSARQGEGGPAGSPRRPCHRLRGGCGACPRGTGGPGSPPAAQGWRAHDRRPQQPPLPERQLGRLDRDAPPRGRRQHRPAGRPALPCGPGSELLHGAGGHAPRDRETTASSSFGRPWTSRT